MKRASKVARLWNSGPKHFEASFEAGLGLWKLEQNSIYISQRRGPFLVLKREEPADAQTWAPPVFDQN